MRLRKLYLLSFVVILLLGVTAVCYWLKQRFRPASVVTATQRTCSPCAHTLILSYGDFGPPSMVYELQIGDAWNQWKNEGHELPDDVEIKVVVYRGVALEEVKKQFPVVRGKSDYRYLEYGRAVQFLEQQEKEVQRFKKDEQDAANSEPNLVRVWEELEQTLKNTRRMIVENLGV